MSNSQQVWRCITKTHYGYSQNLNSYTRKSKILKIGKLYRWGKEIKDIDWKQKRLLICPNPKKKRSYWVSFYYFIRENG